MRAGPSDTRLGCNEGPKVRAGAAGASTSLGAVVGLLADAMAAGPVLLDGGLATELEARGYDLTSALWSARLLADDPGAVVDAHTAYFEAGAQVATTSSYQASLERIRASSVLTGAPRRG